MTGPFDFIMFFVNNPMLACLAMAITSAVMAAKS